MNNKTSWKSAKDVTRNWYEIDATGIPLGRLAGVVAKYLIGKITADYVPNLDMGNFVIIVNAGAVKFTGQKQSYLTLDHYTGYPSGRRVEKVSNLMKEKPSKVIISAVKGMLPTTKQRDTYLSRLHIFTDSTHGHEAQKPIKITA
jgi:large subunit ribosomal protein L13